MSTKPIRLPFVEPLENRNQTLNADRKMVNALAEQSPSGTWRMIKRPGNHVAFTGMPGVGQGITNYLDSLYSVSGDFLNRFSTGSGSTATLLTSAASWQAREGHFFTGFAGKLWVMGGWMQPSLAAPTFSASIGSGAVTGITIVNAGLGFDPTYPTSVPLTITGGGGSGATAHAVVTGQSVTSVVIDTPGTGYTSPPSVVVASTTGWGIMNDVWSSVDGVTWSPVLSQAPWGQRGRGGVAVFNGRMWIMGGGTGTGVVDSDINYSDVWSTVDGVTWTQATSFAWPARRRMGVTVFNGLLWVAGGAGHTANSNPWVSTYYSDCYYSADGTTWTRTVSQAPWMARSDFGFYAIGSKLYVLGGNLPLLFQNATSDLWSSPDGIAWTRESSNPLGVAASGVWPVAAISSMGDGYTIPPPVTVDNTGTGGTGASAYAFTIYDDDGEADDWQGGPIGVVNFSAVGSGYTKAPALTLGASVGVNASFYAFLDGTSNGGSKRFRTAQLGSTIYLLEYQNTTSFVHVVWATTDGVTFTNQNIDFTAGWPPRAGEWAGYGNLFLSGGINSTPTYFSDVWDISLGGSSISLSPDVPGDFYHFNQTSTGITTPLLVFKSTDDLYSYNAALNLLTKLSNVANYPAVTVPGLVYLDGYFFVMDPQGRIWNSAPNDPSTWTALGVIAMQNEPNGGRAIAKLANYVVGFGVWSTEFFYDAGAPAPGSPLLPNITLPILVGCAAGESVVEMQNSIVWVGQTRHEGQGIYMFDGYAPRRISTPFEDRIIQSDPLTSIRAYSLDLYGHPCYILYLRTANLTLVFDFTTQVWSVFTSLTPQGTMAVTSLTCDPYGLVTVVAPNHGQSDGDPVIITGATVVGYNGSFNITYVDNNTFTYLVPSALDPNPGSALMQGYSTSAFNIVAAAQVLDIDYAQDPTNGVVYAQTISDYADHTNPIDMQAATERVDAGVSTWKFLSRLSLICDMVPSSGLISYSDNDYQSWSTYRSLSLNVGERPTTTPGGRFRRRAFRFRHTAATPLRIEAVELELFLGDF